jgi:uncharacterized membrane protein
MDTIHLVIQWCATGIELLAVGIIVVGVLIVAFTHGMARYPFRVYERRDSEDYRELLGKPLLLGLELLVAADVIRTVALEPTLTNIVSLGLLVLVRTFLSWALTVEMEGRWPWQHRHETARDPVSPSHESA